MVALLCLSWCRYRSYAYVSRVHRGHQASDRTTFAGGVPSLEHHADGWAQQSRSVEDSAIDESQHDKTALLFIEDFGFLGLGQPVGEVVIAQHTLIVA